MRIVLYQGVLHSFLQLIQIISVVRRIINIYCFGFICSNTKGIFRNCSLVSFFPCKIFHFGSRMLVRKLLRSGLVQVTEDNHTKFTRTYINLNCQYDTFIVTSRFINLSLNLGNGYYSNQ